MGKTVKVLARGDKFPGGCGKVAGFWTSTIVNERVEFYNVQYEDGKMDRGVEGRYISRVDPPPPKPDTPSSSTRASTRLGKAAKSK